MKKLGTCIAAVAIGIFALTSEAGARPHGGGGGGGRGGFSRGGFSHGGGFSRGGGFSHSSSRSFSGSRSIGRSFGSSSFSRRSAGSRSFTSSHFSSPRSFSHSSGGHGGIGHGIGHGGIGHGGIGHGGIGHGGVGHGLGHDGHGHDGHDHHGHGWYGGGWGRGYYTNWYGPGYYGGGWCGGVYLGGPYGCFDSCYGAPYVVSSYGPYGGFYDYEYAPATVIEEPADQGVVYEQPQYSDQPGVVYRSDLDDGYDDDDGQMLPPPPVDTGNQAQQQPPAQATNRPASPLRNLVSQGDAAFGHGDYEAARQEYTQALLVAGDDASVRMAFGLSEFALGHYTIAGQAITQGVLRGRSPIATGLDLRRMYGKPEDFTTQLATLDQFVTTHPMDANAWFLLGFVRYYSDDHSGAAAALTKYQSLPGANDALKPAITRMTKG